MIRTLCLAFFVLIHSAVHADNNASGWAIASAHPLATYAGLEIFYQGGTAFDAAVAVSAALAVVEPSGSGLGGGGFWLLHDHRKQTDHFIDGRETGPKAAHADMFVDKNGTANSDLSRNGPLAAGIPGLPAALVHLAEHYATLPLATLLAPAIRYAEQGFPVGEHYRKLIEFRRPILQKYPDSAVFLAGGNVPETGWVLKQPDLAQTLKQLASQGRKGFYHGPVANKLVNSVRDHGGIWTLSDLARYRVVERPALQSDYQGIKITSAPLPSSGGIVLSQALNILSGFKLDQLSEISRKHLIIESLRRAYRDRARHLGDSDFVKVPVQRLISPGYATDLRADIDLHQATASATLAPYPLPATGVGADTTHFSIIDGRGNRVAATLSINFPFGSGFVAQGTGVVLNNEMDDFVSQPGTGNGYGLTGGAANRIEPGKRMLSSMTPTFLEDANRIAVLGTPGGSRIISMVLLGVLDFAQGHDPQSWVGVKRFHHQFLPDEVQFERGGLTLAEQNALSAMGHRLKPLTREYGNMQALLYDKRSGQYQAASDPRGEGLALSRNDD